MSFLEPLASRWFPDAGASQRCNHSSFGVRGGTASWLSFLRGLMVIDDDSGGVVYPLILTVKGAL